MIIAFSSRPNLRTKSSLEDLSLVDHTIKL